MPRVYCFLLHRNITVHFLVPQGYHLNTKYHRFFHHDNRPVHTITQCKKMMQVEEMVVEVVQAPEK